MSQSVETKARERLEAFIGKWSLEAGPPDGPPWPGGGWATFEWMKDAPLLIQRSHADLPEAPDGFAVIGCDGKNDGYYQLYTDDRDVQRLYAMSFDDDGVWKLWREGEPFDQRFEGRFSEDGNTIEGRFEINEGDGWRTDFDITYTRVE